MFYTERMNTFLYKKSHCVGKLLGGLWQLQSFNWDVGRQKPLSQGFNNLKPRLQQQLQECISYMLMMKNGQFYWEKVAWATASYSGRGRGSVVERRTRSERSRVRNLPPL